MKKKKLQEMLCRANAITYAQMEEIRRLNKHIDIAEAENRRKEIIIGYLEIKMIDAIRED